MSVAKEAVYKPMEIIIMGIGIFFIFMIINVASNFELDSNTVKSYIIRNKIILDENCLAYNGERVEMGTIDMNKFNINNLNNCLKTKEGIRLNLTYNENSELILINEGLAEKVYFCFDDESFSCHGKEYEVILVKDNKKIPAKLAIDTISLK